MPELLNSILDTHPDIIFRYDAGLKMTYANQAASDFFQQPKDVVIGNNLLELSEPIHRDDIKTQLDTIGPDRRAFTITQPIARPNGTLHIQWTNIGVFDDHDELIGYQSLGRNITREVQLQDQLKQQTKELENLRYELRTVFDAVPATIWYKDDKNNILRVNQAAADSLGMTVEELEGTNTYDVFGESARDYHEDDLKVFRSGVAERGIIEPFEPAEGEQGWVQTDKIPLTDGENGPRILVVATDITALKEQEAILKSINKNLDDFASLTSHDLQAPLRKIGITAELMQLEMGDKLPEGADAYFADIAQGVGRMRMLIKSFLKFMRASPENVELGSVDLTALLRNAAEDETDSLEQADGVLRLPETPIYVRGDAALLTQVFANLINNAIKYRSEERPIVIDITAATEKQNCVINVCDNGAGIDPSFAGQVFDLFGRAKPHMEVEGSGVGLALCRRIITLHGGTIDLIPKDRPGSCFQIKLFRARSTTDG